MELWVATRKDPHVGVYVVGVFSTKAQAQEDIDPYRTLLWTDAKENETIHASRLDYPVTIEYKIEPFLLNVS